MFQSLYPGFFGFQHGEQILALNKVDSLDMIGRSCKGGGALGNLWDRVWHCAVFDFLSLHLGNLPLFVCNFADIAISAGVLLLILDSLLYKPAAAP